MILRGVKAWVHFSRVRTKNAYASRMWICGFRNNHMTSNTCFGRVLAYFCLVAPCSKWLSYTDSEIVETMLGDCSINRRLTNTKRMTNDAADFWKPP